jgi:integrase
MLTEAAIRAEKPSDKQRKLFDERGLYLLIHPNGSRYWRFKYRHAGREKLLALGTYPDVTLKRAREKRDEARKRVADGIDPSVEKQASKAANTQTLRLVYEEWLSKSEKVQSLAKSTRHKDQSRLETYILPTLGSRPIASIKPADLLLCLQRMEAKGIHESAARARSLIGRIFRYAIATQRADRDITQDLRGALTTPKTKNMPAITEPKRIGELLRAIEGYSGQPSTAYALKLAPLVFVRPGELRGAEWSEFELDGKDPEWRIPASRMKMGEHHIVPLSRQSVALLKELHRITGHGKFLFPSLRTNARPMSNNTVNAALRRLGFSGEEMVGHGFRAMASTCLNEQGWHPDVIELQLAHKERNKVRAAYNRAQRIPERRKLMQAWADYLDSLRTGAKVIPFKWGI